MRKSFRPWKVDEVWLLPPSVQEFVPEGHAAHLVRDIVAEELDLSAILAAYTEPRGYPPYHPAMIVALLLYAYSRGVYSSRRIARACEEWLDFQAVTALNRTDFRTISEFRRRHLAPLAALFVQVLALCRGAGLVGLNHVAVDGTKLRANASKHKAMSYARMGQAEAELAAVRWSPILGQVVKLGLPWEGRTRMTGKRTRYSAEFKAKVALEALRGELTAAQLATKHGIHQTMVGDWKRQAVEGLSGVFSGKSAGQDMAKAAEADVEKLHAKIGQLLVERDFLAKASGR